MSNIKAKNSNVLLISHPVGHPRPSSYDLPPPNHTYGITIKKDPFNTAATVLTRWEVKEKAKSKVASLDFVSMNRIASKKGIIDHKEILAYRQAHPIRLKIGESSFTPQAQVFNSAGQIVYKKYMRLPGIRAKGCGPVPSETDPTFTYGIKTVPDLPISQLMTDEYQRIWIEERERKEIQKVKDAKEKLIKKHLKTVNRPNKKTSTQKLCQAEQIIQDQSQHKPLFYLTKFKKIESKINSKFTADGKPFLRKRRDLNAQAC